MTPAEEALWMRVYAAVVGGAIGGPHGFHYIRANSRPETGSGTYIDSVAHAARVYADRAVVDFRAQKKDGER